jgi:hypothetical protein
MKRLFQVLFNMDGEFIDNGIIAIDQKVIDAVDDEFHDQISDRINTPEEIASFIGYNVFVNNADLSSIDGFANLDNNLLHIVKYPILDRFDITAKEITEKFDVE